MPVVLLALVERRGSLAAPVLRVQCTLCERVYLTAQWPTNLPRSAGCTSCVLRFRQRVRAPGPGLCRTSARAPATSLLEQRRVR